MWPTRRELLSLVPKAAQYAKSRVDQAANQPAVTEEQLARELGYDSEQFRVLNEVATGIDFQLDQSGGRPTGGAVLAVLALIGTLGGIYYYLNRGSSFSASPDWTRDLNPEIFPLDDNLTRKELVRRLPPLPSKSMDELVAIYVGIQRGLADLSLPGPVVEGRRNSVVIQGPLTDLRPSWRDAIWMATDAFNTQSQALDSERIVQQVQDFSHGLTEQRTLNGRGSIMVVPDAEKRLEEVLRRAQQLDVGDGDLWTITHKGGTRIISERASRAVIEALPGIMEVISHEQDRLGVPLANRLVPIGSGSMGYPAVEVTRDGQVARLLSDFADVLAVYDTPGEAGQQAFVQGYVNMVRLLQSGELNPLVHQVNAVLQEKLLGQFGRIVGIPTKIGDMGVARIVLEAAKEGGVQVVKIVKYARWLPLKAGH